MSTSLLTRATERWADRFDGTAPTKLETAQILGRAGRMWVRGAALRPLLGSVGPIFMVAPSARVDNPQHVFLGNSVVIETGAEVQGRSKRGIRLGDGVTVGAGAQIRPSGHYGREAGEGLSVGANSNIGAQCYIGCAGYIEIGSDVLIGPGVRLIAENHVFDRTDMSIKDQGVERGSIHIEDDVWIASGATILSNVRIGQGSVIAAGAVVTSDVAPNCIVGGVPARTIRKRDEQ